MLKVSLQISPDGVLKSCKASGHANWALAGSDIVCAAATVLIRTTAKTLARNSHLRLSVDMPKRGELSFTVLDYPASEKAFLCYAASFLQDGLKDLVAEFKDSISLCVVEETNL